MRHNEINHRTPTVAKPYAMVGAGELASAIWKSGNEVAGWRYRFNLFRLTTDGGVGQQFHPADLTSLLKLVRVLAAELADDGCLDSHQRSELVRLAAILDQIFQSKE